MDGQVTAALIISGVSFIAIVVNIIITTKIAARQNKLELKKTRIDLLESRRVAIQQVKKEMFGTNMSVPDIDLTDINNIFPIMIKHYITISNLFLSVENLFPKKLSDNIIKLTDDINERNTQSLYKMEETNTKEDIIARMPQIEKDIRDNIRGQLRDIEEHLQILLKD